MVIPEGTAFTRDPTLSWGWGTVTFASRSRYSGTKTPCSVAGRPPQRTPRRMAAIHRKPSSPQSWDHTSEVLGSQDSSRGPRTELLQGVSPGEGPPRLFQLLGAPGILSLGRWPPRCCLCLHLQAAVSYPRARVQAAQDGGPRPWGPRLVR